MKSRWIVAICDASVAFLGALGGALIYRWHVSHPDIDCWKKTIFLLLGMIYIVVVNYQVHVLYGKRR